MVQFGRGRRYAQNKVYDSVHGLGCSFVFSGMYGRPAKRGGLEMRQILCGQAESRLRDGRRRGGSAAKKDDGKSRTQKYNLAVAKCRKIEPPLVSFCVDGVKKFRTELAKLDPEQPKVAVRKKAARKIAATNGAVPAGRAPASAAPATAAPVVSN